MLPKGIVEKEKAAGGSVQFAVCVCQCPIPFGPVDTRIIPRVPSSVKPRFKPPNVPPRNSRQIFSFQVVSWIEKGEAGLDIQPNPWYHIDTLKNVYV
jgi:hypothetical protein